LYEQCSLHITLKDAKFGVRGLAAQDADDFVVLRLGQLCVAIRSGVIVVMRDV